MRRRVLVGVGTDLQRSRQSGLPLPEANDPLGVLLLETVRPAMLGTVMVAAADVLLVVVLRLLRNSLSGSG